MAVDQITFTAEWFGGEFFTAEWFPYKHDRFERSDKVAMMNLTAEGAYHRAIRIVWREQTMPSDPAVFAARIQKGCTVKVAEAVLKTFLPVPGNPSRVYHPVVEEIRFEQWQKYLNRRKGGIASRNGSILNGANKGGSSITEQCSSITPLDLDLDLKEEESKKSVVSASVHEGTVLAGVTKALGRSELTATETREWTQAAAHVFKENRTADEFLECLTLLRSQSWRDSAVKPKHVIEALPNLETLRKKAKNGTKGKSNGGRSSSGKDTAGTLASIGARPAG